MKHRRTRHFFRSQQLLTQSQNIRPLRKMKDYVKNRAPLDRIVGQINSVNGNKQIPHLKMMPLLFLPSSGASLRKAI
jgi:hypothetical protein